MATPILDLPRHKLAEVFDKLAATIRQLEKENADLHNENDMLKHAVRKADHGCYNFNCSLCDKE